MRLHRFAAPALAVSLAAAGAARAEIRTPLVDHHQHLLSPAGAALVNPKILPAVSLPADLAKLLEQRAALTKDPALAGLFAKDALFLKPASRAWAQDGKAAIDINEVFYPGYRLTPVWLRTDGKTAQIAGHYERGEGATLRRPGFFTLTAARDAAGAWKIIAEVPVFPGPAPEPVLDGEGLVALLDRAGIRRAVVLSDAYYFDQTGDGSAADYAKVRAENDWTGAQAARFPDRLAAFCSFNPLASYAMEELDRCVKSKAFKGLKLHFGSSRIDIKQPDQAAKVRGVFAAANARGLPIIAHMAASPDYGQKDAEVFLTQLLPAAPDVPVVVAHLWGGAGYADSALTAFADAVAARAAATRNLYFEVAQVSLVAGRSEEDLKKIAAHMRRIGFDRILYGSDGPQFGGKPPREVWADFREKVPLTEAEMNSLAANVAPYMR